MTFCVHIAYSATGLLTYLVTDHNPGFGFKKSMVLRSSPRAAGTTYSFYTSCTCSAFLWICDVPVSRQVNTQDIILL